ncbi:MAG: hypothetical protein HY243_03915 [Proteobacteria bacterium]|nr:hypothetical protein [Pseudomonadota bacterium]
MATPGLFLFAIGAVWLLVEQGGTMQMRAVMLIALSVAMLTFASSAGEEYPQLPAHARSINDFIPAGWEIEIQDTGILENNDRVATVFVASDQAANHSRSRSAAHRILVIAFRNTDGTFDLAVQNHTLLPRLSVDTLTYSDYEIGSSSVTDRWKGVEIRRGTLRVHLDQSFDVGPNAESDTSYAFRYRKSHLELVGYDHTGITFHGGELITSINYLTRKLSLARGTNCVGRLDVVKKCSFKTTWKRLPPASLLTIDDIGDGLVFSPRIDF